MRAGDVRIDRRGPFGNRFAIGRAEAITPFETRERERLTREPERRAAVAALHGQRLFCWCHPRPCHGDVLARLAAELVAAGEREAPDR